MKVQYRGGFSDRNKIDPINTTIQLKDLDSRSRIALLNYIVNIIKDLENHFREYYFDFLNLHGQNYIINHF